MITQRHVIRLINDRNDKISRFFSARLEEYLLCIIRFHVKIGKYRHTNLRLNSKHVYTLFMITNTY